MQAEPKRNWIGFLVERPIAVFTALLTILVLGIISYHRIPIQFLPSGFGSQDISVFVPFSNSNPYETLEKITRRVEEELETIPGIARLESNSGADGCWVQMEFSGRANMDLAAAEIRDRMERVRPRLPNGADRYFIWRFSLDDSFPIVFGGMLFDLDSTDDKANYLAEEIIKKRIESIDGVARMQIHGLLGQSVRILLDEDRCRAARLNLGEVVTRLAKDNFATPIGKIQESGSRYLLRVDSKFANLEEIRNIPITAQLRVKDVGEVKYVQSVREQLARINGKFALFAEISRNSGANTVEICKKISAAVAELENRTDLEGFKFLKFFDQGQMIEGSLRNLGDSALWGAIYAMIVLFLFLHRARLTLLVALAIPVSFLMTLVYQHFSGETFNVLSMMGMTLGVGMLVDNAIVVVENIYRLKQEGKSFREAAVRGTQEVGLAITLSTLTSIVVFLPLMFMSEDRNLRIMTSSVGIPLSVSLLASLVVALIFIPAAIYHLQGEKGSRAEAWMKKLPSFLPFFSTRIQKILNWSLNHRVAASLIFLGFLFTIPVAQKGMQKASGGDGGQHFHIEFDLPRNTTLTEAGDEVKVYEDSLLAKKKEYEFENISSQFDRIQGDVRVWYDGLYSSERLREKVKIIQEGLPKLPGTKIRIRTHLGGDGGEQSSGLRLVLTGRDPSVLAELGTEVKRRLEKVSEFTSVVTALENGRQEVHVKLDREKTTALALSPQMVTEIIEWGLRGYSLPRFQEQDRELPFIIQFAKGADESLNDLRDFKIFTAAQKEVPLAALASFAVDKGYGQIFRINGKTVLTVRADSNQKDLGILAAKSRAALADLEFPTGYGWYEEGGLQQWEEDSNEILNVAILAIVFVFLLMGVLFESAILPFSILFTIPFAALGGFWLLNLTKTPLDGVGMIGFVVLVGVVVNNGIILVDHINRLRVVEGLDRRNAIQKGSADRLRPILMTALTTIVGLLPLALAKTNPQEGISYGSLAMTVIGGLSISTLFTLWVVPLVYTLVEDLRSGFQKVLAKKG